MIFCFAALVFLSFPGHRQEVDRHQEGSGEKDDGQEDHYQEEGGAQESQKARGGQENQDDEKVSRQEGGAQEKGRREAVIIGLLRGEAVSVFVRPFVCFYCGAMPYTM